MWIVNTLVVLGLVAYAAWYWFGAPYLARKRWVEEQRRALARMREEEAKCLRTAARVHERRRILDDRSGGVRTRINDGPTETWTDNGTNLS
jgi:hypothetical protein